MFQLAQQQEQLQAATQLQQQQLQAVVQQTQMLQKQQQRAKHAKVTTTLSSLAASLAPIAVPAPIHSSTVLTRGAKHIQPSTARLQSAATASIGSASAPQVLVINQSGTQFFLTGQVREDPIFVA